MPVTDGTGWEESAGTANLANTLRELAQRPFDLSRDLLLRPALVRLRPDCHVLVLVVHHIASDGWSTGVLLRELAVLYQGHQEACASPLPAPLPIQYADYALWQRRHLDEGGLAKQLAYWQGQLAQPLPVLELANDRSRSAQAKHSGARQWLALPDSLVAALRTLSRGEGVTLFMILLAAFYTLLHRYTGQEDLIVGSPTAGRTRAETQGLIGCFINPLVLRTSLAGNPSFRELLARVREIALGAYANQDLPFEKLVEVLQPERTLVRGPLFQVLFNMVNVPRQPLSLPGIEAEELRVDPGIAKYDLTLQVDERKDGLTCFVEYDTGLFAHHTMSRLLGHWQTLLEGVVAGPGERLADLPLLTADERRQLLVEWNDTRADYPREACLHHLFEEQVRRTPDVVAAIAGDACLTYRELNRRANELARCLRGRGVDSGTLVGLCLERSLEALVGMLGILKAGGAYLPLDPSYPRERLVYMLATAEAPLVLTKLRWHDRLAGQPATVLCLDADWLAIAEENPGQLEDRATATDVAYAIFTSGSTGQPKAVLGLHRGIANRLYWQRATYPFAPGEVCCQKTSLAFLDSVAETFGPLTSGVPLVIISEQVVRDPRRLVRELAARQVTRLVVVPSLLRLLLDTHPDLRQQLPSLKHWTSSSEPLPADLARRFLERMPDCLLLNLYGSSEVSADVTCCNVRQADPSLPLVPIGRPIANTQVYVLDAHGNLAPIGAPGEIHIAGPSLARGYLKSPELTAARFVSNPFDDDPHSRLFKTGDLGRWRPDGQLEFLGRLDQQVKVRGCRVEPAEIEAALRQHPAVAEAAVALRADHAGEPRLVAYVVPAAGHAVNAAELRRSLGEKIPDYSLPDTYISLAALPLNANGKLDREALPVPERSRAQTGQDFTAPRDPLELRLARVWEAVLATQPIGIQDDFFALGGHSLLGVRLVSEIEKELGRQLPLGALYEAPTVARLAEALRGNLALSPWTSLLVLQAGDNKPPLFWLHGAGRWPFWYQDVLSHLAPDQPVFGVVAPGMDGRQPVYARVEDMAAHYIKEIRALQPQGPYYVCGPSASGAWAFEVARQLHAAGQEVALLALFDSPYPGKALPFPPPRRGESWLRGFLRVSFGEKGSYLRKQTGDCARLWLKAWCRWRLYETARRLGLAGRLGLNTWLPTVVSQAAGLAWRRYRPRPYEGRTTLFFALGQFALEGPDLPKEWAPFAAGGLQVLEVPGAHDGILAEPHMQVLAQHLRRRLAGTPSPTAAATGS